MAEFINKTDTLNKGREKINKAIEDADRAKWESGQALDKASQARMQSASTQAQLDTVVVEGDSSVEAAQARVDSEGNSHATLKQRLDSDSSLVNQGLEEKASKEELQDGLSGNAYYQNITVKKHRDLQSDSDYYLTKIPHKDENGAIIKIKRGFAGDIPNGGIKENLRNFSKRHNGTVVFNASAYNTDTMKLLGTQIYNGEVLNEEAVNSRYMLGIKDDNTFVWYPPGTPSTTIIADGIKNALTSFIPLIENGAQVDQTIIDGYSASSAPHPRQVIAQYPNKDILVFTCEGRTVDDIGMTIPDVIRILLAEGVDFAFNLDGGGSVQTVVRGTLINTPSDNNGYTEREVPDFLYFGKEDITNRDKDIVITSHDLGEISREVAKILIDVNKKQDKANGGFLQLLGSEGYKTQGVESWEGGVRKTKLNLREDQLMYWDYVKNSSMFTVTDTGDLSTRKGTFGNFLNTSNIRASFNEVISNGFYWIAPGAAGAPETTASYAVVYIQSVPNGEALQIAIPYTSNTAIRAKRRRCNPSINWFDSWQDL